MKAQPAFVDLSPEPTPSTSGSHELPSSPIPVMPGVRVLLACPDPHVRRALDAALRRHGFETRLAADAEAALTAAEHAAPDLIVLDRALPGDERALLQRLKLVLGAAVHISVLSGTDDEEARVELFDAGADDLLAKPISSRELCKRLAAAARVQQAYITARQAREHADRLLAWGSEAAGLLAHDLNNNLATALLTISMFAESLTLDEDCRDAMNASLTSLRRMSSMVANFVDIGRFEDACVQVRRTPVSIATLIGDVLQVHTGTRREVRASVTCPPGLTCRLDEALVARVLHNLVGNALRYCPKDGAIAIAAAATERGIELAVHNQGPAIPAALLPRLFGKYALGKDGQRGLGLYFCRLAIEAHGGTIAHVADPDGPTFVLRIPDAR